MEQQVRSILELAYYDDTKIPSDAITAYAVPMNTPGGRHALIQTAKQLIPPNIEQISSKYKKIQVPTLSLWGRQDEIVPLQIGERLHQDIPNSQLVVMDQSGHTSREERP
jgi:pimeloyl-ACP methyl ester carboxylesterase